MTENAKKRGRPPTRPAKSRSTLPPPTRRLATIAEDTRLKIRATKLIERLQTHVFAPPCIQQPDGSWATNPDLLTPTQVKAAETLLNKILPSLANVVVEADAGSLSLLAAIDAAARRADRLRDGSTLIEHDDTGNPLTTLPAGVQTVERVEDY